MTATETKRPLGRIVGFVVVAIFAWLIVQALQPLLGDGLTAVGRRNPSQGPTSSASTPAGPAVTDPATDRAEGLACGRLGTGSGAEPFTVWADGLDPTITDVTVMVAIVERDGTRRSHLIQLPATSSGGQRQQSVPESSDPGQHLTCVIEAIELDEQLIRTGR